MRFLSSVLVGVLGASLTGCKNSTQNLKASTNSTSVSSNSTEVPEVNTVIEVPAPVDKPEDVVIDTPIQDKVIETPEAPIQDVVIETPEAPIQDVVIETPEAPIQDMVIETSEAPIQDVVIDTPSVDVVDEIPAEVVVADAKIPSEKAADVTGEDEEYVEEEYDEAEYDKEEYDEEEEDPIVEDIKKESALGFLKRKTLVENPVLSGAGALLTVAALAESFGVMNVIPNTPEERQAYLNSIFSMFKNAQSQGPNESVVNSASEADNATDSAAGTENAQSQGSNEALDNSTGSAATN